MAKFSSTNLAESVISGTAAVLLLSGSGCAQPTVPAPVAPPSEPPDSAPSAPHHAAAAVPKLPIALDSWTVCKIESGRAHCRIGSDDVQLPHDRVRALGAGTSTLCAIHDDVVDCELRRREAEPVGLQFEAPEAVEVPDFVANRMGIVNCANEAYGSVPDDPAIAQHLGRD